MAKKLFVGGIPFRSTQESLKAYFEQAGEVSEVVIINDKATGRSRGFGFVTYNDDAAADKAISMFHDQEFEGRKLLVNEAKPKEENRDSR